jgi:hypothetical protein
VTGRYRFLKTRGGITGFASVTVESTPAPELTVSWDPRIAPNLYRDYGTAAREGVTAAFRAHQKRGGLPQQVQISELLETVVDTRPDAVRCAAGIAAWKSWGWPESDVTILNQEGEWTAAFKDESSGEPGS